MIIIKTADSKFWTEEYTETNGFLKFITTSKAGAVMKHEINKSSVLEIIEMPEKNELPF